VKSTGYNKAEMSFSLGPAELILIFLIAFFFFGARRLPKMNSDDDPSSNPKTEDTGMGVSFYIVLIIMLGLFVLAEFWLLELW
jgi:hypothetical protein